MRGHDRQRSATGLVQPRDGAGEDADRRRVDERDLGEVEHQPPSTGLDGADQTRPQLRAGLVVEFASHGQDSEIAVFGLFDLHVVADKERPHTLLQGLGDGRTVL